MKTKSISLALLSLGVVAAANAQIVVNANGTLPGDNFTNAGPSGISQNVTSYTGPTGDRWVYNNVRDLGEVGINTTFARSGNASARIATPGISGAGGSNARADINLVNNAGFIGALDQLTNWKADLLTQSSSFANQSVVVRMSIASTVDTRVSGSGIMFGDLVFDTTWNPGTAPAITFGSWQTFDFMANASTIMVRGSGQVGIKYNDSINGGERTLASYLSLLAGKSYAVTSIGAGFGGSSGQFEGAVDNYTVGFNNAPVTYNFEAVPEPTSMIALGLGALGLIKRRRK